MDTLNNAAKAVTDTAATAVNYVNDTLQGKSAETKAEVNKETLKSGESSLGQKVDAGLSFGQNKLDQHSSEASAEVNKQKLENK